MKRLMLIALILFAAFSVLSAKTVLIAKEDTGYKKALVNNLLEKLEADNITVEVIDHKDGDLSGVNPADYDAVYVLNSGAQARVRPAVQDWLDSVSAADTNVILHTTQRTVWTPQVDVDSITSASKKSNIDEMTDDIVMRIKAKF